MSLKVELIVDNVLSFNFLKVAVDSKGVWVKSNPHGMGCYSTSTSY